MKKGRPGLNLTVLVKDHGLEQVQAFLLEHTSSIGLRYQRMERIELPRTISEVETPFGPVRIKEVIRPSARKSRKIEYEDLQRIREKTGRSIHEIQEEIIHYLAGASSKGES